MFALFLLTVFRYYGDVEYRLNLNYQRYFIYYLLIGIGYLAGFVIYRITDRWLWIYLVGEVAALCYVAVTGSVFHKFFQRSGHFFVALERGFFLTLSYLITNTTMNMDRLVIKQILGNEQVTIYYVISLIGKTLVLLIAPINTIVISYLTKRRELLNRSQFGKAVLAGGGVAGVFFLGCQVGTPLFVWLFYHDLFPSIKGLVTVVNLAQVLGLFSAFLFILVLTFTDEKWQLWIQLAQKTQFVFIQKPLTIWRMHNKSFNYKLTLSRHLIDASFIWNGFRKYLYKDFLRSGETKAALFLCCPFWVRLVARIWMRILYAMKKKINYQQPREHFKTR